MRFLKVVIGLAVFGVLLFGSVGDVAAQATSVHTELVVPKSAIRSDLVTITYRNGASADTTKRLFTGAAVLADTSREVIDIFGANTISIQNTYTIKEDSGMVHVYLQVSNDRSRFFTFGSIGTGGALPAGSGGGAFAVDSVGLLDTGDSPFTRVVNIASPPTWARYARVIARKALSAATDSVELETSLTINRNDE